MPFSCLRRAAFCLVFFGIPLLMVCAWYGKLWAETENLRRQKMLQAHDNRLTSILKWQNPGFYFNALLRQFNLKLRNEVDPLPRLERFLRQLKRRFPEYMIPVVVTPRGVDECLSEGNPPRHILKKFFEAHRQACLSDSLELAEAGLNLFKAYFGGLLKPSHIRSEDLNEVSYTNDKAYAYFSQAYPFGMFILFFHRKPGWDSCAIADLLRSQNRRKPQTPVFLFDSKATGPASLAGGVNLAGIAARLEAASRDSLFLDGRWWLQKIFSPTERLLTCFREEPDPLVETARFRLVLAVALFFTVATLIAWPLMAGRWEIYLSIRLKLLLLFLFSVGLPIAILFINARDYLGELRYRLEDQLQTQIEKHLDAFDRNFPQIFGVLQKIILRQLAAPAAPGRSLVEKSQDNIRRLMRVIEPAEALLIDQQGDCVVPPRTREYRNTAKMLKNVYAFLLNNINTGEVNVEELRENNASKMATAVGFEVEQVYSEWARSLNTLREYRYGLKKGVQSFFPVLDEKGIGRFLIAFSWSHYRVQEQYLRRYLLRLQKSLPDTTLYAKYWNPEKPSVWFTESNVPPVFRYARMTRGFLKRMMDRGQGMRARVVRGENTFLLTGARGTQVANYYFVAVTNDRQIRRTIEDFLSQLRLLSAGIILIALMVVSLLARQFLAPVGHLSEGVKALRERRFGLRLPVLERDEFGDLSGTFNQMMESMADLEVARIVQESLFPSGAVRAGPCAVFGTCQPASEVGGDYFDYFPIAGERILLVIGDVSGHGVPAAIVMGMAKASVINLSDRSSDPAEMMLQMHTMLLRTLNRKKMMSCFLAIFDTVLSQLHYCNAGHNAPYRIRAGRIEALKGNGYPLGSRIKARYENAVTALEPGDRFVFYTDGLIEAMTAAGDVIGYPATEAALPGLLRETPEASEHAIRDWHRTLARSGPQADDITILVVHYDGIPVPPASPEKA